MGRPLIVLLAAGIVSAALPGDYPVVSSVIPAVMSPARAHHSVLGFDGSRAVTLAGVVHEVIWQNPHTYIVLDVDTNAERGERWLIESESPIVLERLGWTAASVAAGERIRTLGAAARDGRRTMRCDYVERIGPLPVGDDAERGGTGAEGAIRHLPCFPSGPRISENPTGSGSTAANSGRDR